MHQTIEEIENEYWPEPPKDASYLVLTCHQLRKKNIDRFSVEDYRILIGQSISLEILIPPALEILHKNIFAEGDFYEGDLLNSLLVSSKKFWKIHPEMKQELIQLFESNMNALEELDTTHEVKESIKKAFDEFKIG